MVKKGKIFMKKVFKNKDKNMEQSLKKRLDGYTILATCCSIATALSAMVTCT